MTTKQEILDTWQSLHVGESIAQRLGEQTGARAKLIESKIERLKKNGRSTIWRLEAALGDRHVPLILKTFLASHANNVTEINLYEKGYPFLQDFLPQIYRIEHNASHKHGRPVSWVFMEPLQPLHGQLRVRQPQDYFDHVVPALAKLHAHTFEDRYRQHQELFRPWFPEYTSAANLRRRQERLASARKALDNARHDRFQRSRIKPISSLLDKVLKKGPGYFPELLAAGLAITHGDLHEKNICCADIHQAEWHVRYIDWEGAEFAPVWLDVAQLVEVLIDYRDDWHAQEEELRTRYVALYTDEMKKHGITFKTDPMKLYKMGYLELMLEKGLYYELHDLLSGRDGELLDRYFLKLKTWGRELGLI